jgi:hypothetical protein
VFVKEKNGRIHCNPNNGCPSTDCPKLDPFDQNCQHIAFLNSHVKSFSKQFKNTDMRHFKFHWELGIDLVILTGKMEWRLRERRCICIIKCIYWITGFITHELQNSPQIIATSTVQSTIIITKKPLKFRTYLCPNLKFRRSDCSGMLEVFLVAYTIAGNE